MFWACLREHRAQPFRGTNHLQFCEGIALSRAPQDSTQLAQAVMSATAPAATAPGVADGPGDGSRQHEATSPASSGSAEAPALMSAINAVGSVSAAAFDWLFQERDSVADQYEIPPSQRLFDRVKLDYYIKEKQGKVVKIEDLRVHDLNHRAQAAVIRRYAEKIKAYGNAYEARGRAVAVETHRRDNGAPYLLVSYGTLYRGLELAKTLWPDNENVKHAYQAGLPIDVMHARTPKHIVEWVRDWLNQFHGGVEVSCLELMMKVREANANWKVYADGKIDSRAGGPTGYSQQRFKWVVGKYPGFPSPTVLDKAISLDNTFKERQWCDYMRRLFHYMGEYVDFGLSGFSQGNAIQNLNAWTSSLDAIKDAVPAEDMHIVHWEGVKFMLPMSAAVNEVGGGQGVGAASPCSGTSSPSRSWARRGFIWSRWATR